MRKWVIGIILIVVGFASNHAAVVMAREKPGIVQPGKTAYFAAFAPDLGTEHSWSITGATGVEAASTGRANGQPPPASRLSFLAAGPVDLLITDPEGRRVGVDPATGEVIQEIPDVFYYGPHETYEGLA